MRAVMVNDVSTDSTVREFIIEPNSWRVRIVGDIISLNVSLFKVVTFDAAMLPPLFTKKVQGVIPEDHIVSDG